MHRLAVRLVILALIAAPVLIVAQSRPATADWPHWRGPGHTGATTANVPLTWSDTASVRWKAEIPGRGHSTPVASGNRLFLTTAVPTGRKTGKVVWRLTAGDCRTSGAADYRIAERTRSTTLSASWAEVERGLKI